MQRSVCIFFIFFASSERCGCTDPEVKGPAGLDGGANGEGNLMYPGPDGPLASNRLILVAEGIEDWQLFRRLGLDNTSISNGDDLITQLVTNETARHEDPGLLEKLRREAAHRAMAAQH